MEPDNRKRALAEAVSLDAWHKGMSASCRKASLYVDVAFTEGRIGGGDDDEVRFKLSLKRVEVVVVVPVGEPAKIDKASVCRDTPKTKVKITETERTKTEIKGEVSAGAKAGIGGVIPTIGGKGRAAKKKVLDRAVKHIEDAQTLSVMQQMTPDGEYAWRITASTGGVLDGHPWDAEKKPRLKFTDTRRDRAKHIEPAVRVEIRCRREDLEITEIVLKNEPDWASFLGGPNSKNKTIAAEAVIRTRLAEAGLLHGDLRDPYAMLTLCAVSAEGQ